MSSVLDVNDFSGRPHVEPSTDTEVLFVGGQQPATNNIFAPVILGRFNAGESGKTHTFADYASFLKEHDPERIGGTAALVADFCFQPGTTLAGPPAGPPSVRTVRVGAAAQVPTAATSTLDQPLATPVINMTSIGTGTYVNQLRRKLEAGSSQGSKFSLGYKDNPAWVKVGDNLGEAFTVRYTGNGATALLAVTLTGDLSTTFAVVLTTPSDGSASFSLDLTSPDFATAQQVFDFINRQIEYTAVLVDSDLALSDLPSSELDAVVAGDVKAAPVSVDAELGAITSWIAVNCTKVGPIKGITATRVATERSAPAVEAAFILFTGGTQIATIAADWDAALAQLVVDEVETGLIILDTSDTLVHAQVTAFIDAQEALGSKWRAVIGMANTGVTSAAAKIYASGIDRKACAITYQRLGDIFDPTLFHDPIMFAAALGGATGGINFDKNASLSGIVLTANRFRFGDIKPADKFGKPEREDAIRGGLMVAKFRRGGIVQLSLGRSSHIEKGVDGELFLMKWSESLVIDMIERTMETFLKPLQVAWATEDYVMRVKRGATKVLELFTERDFITPGLDPNTGALRPAYTPPIVTVLTGSTSIVYSISIAGESDHHRLSMSIHRVALSSEA